MDDVIGATQATFGMTGTTRALLDDADRELNRGDPRRPLETHSSRALMPQSEAAGASTTTMQTMTTTETQGDLEWSCSMLQPPSALHSHDDDVRELDQKKTFRTPLELSRPSETPLELSERTSKVFL